MAWNGKCSLESASKSLPKTSSLLKALPLDMPLLRIRIIVIASVNIAVAQLKEEEVRIRKGRFACLVTCRCGTSVVLSSSAKSLVTDENTRE